MLYLSELMGKPLRDRQGAIMGRVRDVVAKLPAESEIGERGRPRLHGLVMDTGRGGAGFFVPVDRLGRLRHDEADLASPLVSLEAFARREDELLLAKDVWDHRVI